MKITKIRDFLRDKKYLLYNNDLFAESGTTESIKYRFFPLHCCFVKYERIIYTVCEISNNDGIVV